MVDWIVIILFLILLLAVIFSKSQGPRSQSSWIEAAPIRLFEKNQRRRRRTREEDRLAEVLNLWIWLLVAFACIWIAAIRFS